MPVLFRHTALVLLGVLCWMPMKRARAESHCRLLRVADLPVTMDRNQVLLRGDLNGRSVQWMMDTGSQVSMITGPAADRAGLHRRALFNYILQGVGGRAETYLAHVDALTLGDWTLRDLDMLVASDHDLGDADDEVGVIGETLFEQYDVELDLGHTRVVLYKADDCDTDVRLAYWEGRIGSVPIRRSADEILVPVEINGKEVDALVDSGSDTTVISMAFADDLGLHPGDVAVQDGGESQGVGDKVVKSYLTHVDSFTIGDETIKNARIEILDQSHIGRGVHMLLGADFLRAHRVLVAHSQHRLYFSYVGGPVFQVRGPPRRFTPPGQAEAPPPSSAPSPAP